MPVKDEIEILSQLLQAVGIVSVQDLDQAIKCAKQLDRPLEEALVSLKLASLEQLQPVLEAKQMIDSGEISLMVANQVLVTMAHGEYSFVTAYKKLKNEPSPVKTLSAPSDNPYADYFLSAHLVSLDQLNQALIEAEAKKAPLGRTLVVNRFVSRWALGEVINSVRLIKQGKIKGKDVVHALRQSIPSKSSVIQTLFESGAYQGCHGDTITIVELLVMAGCVNEADYFDLEELEVVEHKSLQQLIAERQLVEPKLMEDAESLFNMIGTYLKPFQAAEALKQIKAKNITTYQAIAELKPPPQVPQPQLRIGDLLVESGITTRDAVEQVAHNATNNTLVRIGKCLLDAHLISEISLYNTLRCQSLYREGIISAEQTIAVLTMAHNEKIKLEDAFMQSKLYVPVRMQWTWMGM